MKFIFAGTLLIGLLISMSVSAMRYINDTSDINGGWLVAANILMLGGFVGLLVST